MIIQFCFKRYVRKILIHLNTNISYRATGFITMKVGKIAAFAVGGGIIMLQIAAHQGYIKINWDKIQRKAEKITDRVEEQVTGEGPKFMDKARAILYHVKFLC